MLEVDDSRFPLVVMTNRDEFTADDALKYEDTLDALYARDERFALVFLSVGVKMPEARILRRLSVWMRERRRERRTLEVATAVYLSSTFIRGALRFINQLAPPPSPQEVFDSQEAAMSWAQEMLASESMPMNSRTG